MNMPSYQEMVRSQSSRNGRNRSHSSRDRGCACKDVLIVDMDTFQKMPLQIMIQKEDKNGAEEADNLEVAMEKIEEKMNDGCYCGRDMYELVFIDVDQEESINFVEQFLRKLKKKNTEHEFKEMPRIQEPYVVGLIERDEAKKKTRALEVGVCEVHTKPIQMEQIEAVFAKSQAKRE